MKAGTKTITLRVSKELYDNILNEAKIEERSVNNFISYAVKTYIETKKDGVKKQGMEINPYPKFILTFINTKI